MGRYIDSLLGRIINKKELRHYCYAPYNNLYFRFDGKVSLCCKNNENIIGVYPGQSLQEIIEGKTRARLSEAFANNQILSGCYNCYEKLCNGNPEAAAFKVYLKPHINCKTLATLEFELSNHCNLKCIMCSEKYSDKHELSPKIKSAIVYDNNFVDQLEPYIRYLKRASFKGGEPFLIELNYEIWKKIISINKKTIISVTSNGTVLNERVREILTKGKFDINISVDSLVKENFEMIRQNASFEVFRKNLDYFLNYCKIKRTNFASCTCIMTNNFQDIPAIFVLANENKFNVFINYVEQPDHLSLKYVEKIDLAKAIRFLQEKRPSFGFFSNKKNLQTYIAMIKQLETWYKAKPEKIPTEEIQSDISDNINIQILLKKFQQNITAFYNNTKPEESDIYKYQMDKFINVYKKSSAYIPEKKLIDFFLTSNDSMYFKLFVMTEDQMIDLLMNQA